MREVIGTLSVSKPSESRSAFTRLTNIMLLIVLLILGTAALVSLEFALIPNSAINEIAASVALALP